MSDLMDPGDLRDAMRAFLSLESTSRTVRDIGAGDEYVKAALWKKMADLGWLGLPIPEMHGGLGCGYGELAVAYEEFGRALTPVPFASTGMAADLLVRAASASLQAALLPRIARGELTATVAFPEMSGEVRLVEHNILRGGLNHVLDAESDWLLVPCIDGDSRRFVAVLERGQPGIDIRTRDTIDMTRILGTVTCDGVAVDPDRLLPVSDGIWASLLDHACLAIASDCVGAGTHILERTVDYMKSRVQFGRPIGSFQALKHRCAQWRIQQEAAAALTAECARQLSLDSPGRSTGASRAKYFAAEYFVAVAGDAVQLHGGIGFTWDHDCHWFLKRAKLNQQLFGSTAFHQERIAADIFNELRMPREAICT